MTSRKNLKKGITNSFGILYNDLILYKVFTKNADVEKADKLIDKIADTHFELISRVSTSEGKDVKGRTKAYYNKIKADLKTALNQYAKEIAELA